MTNPNDPQNADFRATLPADLQELDRELSGIRIEERPSFGPELHGELTKAWRDRPTSGFAGKRPWRRNLLAACLAGLMIAGVSVPGARAAVVTLVRTVAEEVFPDIFSDPEPEEPVLPEIIVEEAPVAPPEQPRTEVVVTPMDASNEIEEPEPDLMILPEVIVTFPEILDRQEATRIIQAKYPQELRDEGVEGTIKLRFWVNPEGWPESIQKDGTSGDTRLDYQAMLATREIRFRPATRNGAPVGTWVEMEIHFFAITGDGIIGSNPNDSGG
jgi:TonB family protein